MNIYALAFTPDAKDLAFGTLDFAVWFRKVASGQDPWQLSGAQGGCTALALSADGKTLAARGDWATPLIHLWDIPSRKKLRTIHAADAHFCSLSFSPDGKVLASGQSEGGAGKQGAITLWDVATGKALRRFGECAFEVAPVVFSPDGHSLAAGTYQPAIDIWEVATCQKRLSFSEGVESRFAFSPDCRWLVVGKYDGAICFWNLATGDQRRSVKGHRANVYQVCFSGDGRTLASSSDDGTVLVWDMNYFRQFDRRAVSPLREDELKRCWTELAGDAASAYRAVWQLARSPQQAAPFLRGQLRPVPPTVAKDIARLVRELDSDSATARRDAVEELDRLAEAAEPALRKALQGQPSPELRRRASDLLEKLTKPVPPPERLQALRGVEALELMNTLEARQLLAALAKGAPEARLTQEAKGALERSAKRPPP